MRRRDQNVLDEIGFLRPHARHALAAAFLILIRVETQALDIAAVRNRYDDVVFVDQIFDLKSLRCLVNDFSPSSVAEFVFDRRQLRADYLKHFALVGKDRLEVCYRFERLLIIAGDLIALEPRQFLQSKVEYRLRLRIAQLKPSDQLRFCVGSRRALTDRFDHIVEIVERLRQALEYMSARLSPSEFKLRPPRDDLFLMFDVELQNAFEVERLRLAVDEREHVHAEGVLHGRVLIEQIEHDLSVDIFAEIDGNSHAVPV